MKKFLFCAVLGLVICLCGCVKEVNYTTKYIANCVSTEFRQGPSNAATVLNNLMHGEIVSFEKDVHNGYSKVIHKGVTGYVLSSFLSDEKPEGDNIATPGENLVKDGNDNTNEYGYLIANQGEQLIEEYITTFVRPLYNQINDNINLYSKNVSASTTIWYDEKIV